MSGELQFVAMESAKPWAYLVAPLVLILAFVAWWRSGGRLKIAVLEGLRVALVACILFALFQPEWVTAEPSSELPKVAVLVDDSESMQTQDVVDAKGAGGVPLSRAGWVQQYFDAQTLEGNLQGRFAVIASEFSNEEGELKSTDMATPMADLLKHKDLRALVVLGDGDWNSGASPSSVAMQYRMREIPILTSTLGSRQALPDVEFLSVDPPAFAQLGKPLAIPFAIRSSMDRDLLVTVSLEPSEGLLLSQEVLLRARETFEGHFSMVPMAEGTLDLLAKVPLQSGELHEGNNEANAQVEVRAESLRVLLIESKPRWEYRYLRNAMVRDPGVEVDCYLVHPDLKELGGGAHYLSGFPAREQLVDYDVVFVGDVGVGPKGLSDSECEMIRGLVAQQASGLILMPGFGGHQISLLDSELGPLFPVELDRSAPFGHGSAQTAQLLLTEAGRQSSLTRLAPDERSNAILWNGLPGFQWHAAVLRALPGSSVLAVHSSRDDGHGRLPLIATKNFGTGKVLFMGTEAAWRWREGVEDRIHYRYWRQVIRWMAYQRKMNAGESMRFYYQPDRPVAGRETLLFANVMDAGGAPLLGGDVKARIESPSGRIARLTFSADEGEWGLFRSTFQPQEPGEHKVTLTCQDTGDRLVTSVDVAGTALEQMGRPARPEIMAELSRISRGEVLQGSDLGRLERYLLALGDPPPVIHRIRLWSHPLFGLVVGILMFCFWVGRKWVGRF
ncbi:MAG: hypothetical protein GY930_09025 [bacterium]|nr:hypothetical protein [bacterium]